MKILNESWQRYPSARVRLREGDLEVVAEAFKNKGYCIPGPARIELVDGGVYISFGTQTSNKNSSVVFLPIEIFLPIDTPWLEVVQAEEPIPAPVSDAETESQATPILQTEA